MTSVLSIPIDYDTLEAAAQEKLSPEAYDYAAGGAGEGHSMDANRAAFLRWQILPRMLGDVSPARPLHPGVQHQPARLR